MLHLIFENGWPERDTSRVGVRSGSVKFAGDTWPAIGTSFDTILTLVYYYIGWHCDSITSYVLRLRDNSSFNILREFSFFCLHTYGCMYCEAFVIFWYRGSCLYIYARSNYSCGYYMYHLCYLKFFACTVLIILFFSEVLLWCTFRAYIYKDYS